MAEATHSDNFWDVEDEEICVSSCPCGRLEWGLSASGIYFERRQAPCLPWCDSQYEKED